MISVNFLFCCTWKQQNILPLHIRMFNFFIFIFFIFSFYNRDEILDNFAHTRKIQSTDQRVQLHNEDGLFAFRKIPQHTFLGVYTGKIWTEAEFIDYLTKHCILSFFSF